MRKVSIVAPIGTSPPVITEFLQYVEEVLDQRVTDITIITTKEPLVLEGLELVKAGVADRYPKVHVHVIELPYDDVDSEERSMEFIRVATKILRDQKEKYSVEVVHLCVAGGRKEVCIILSLLAQFYNVNGVYHIVMPDVKTFNQQLELIRHEARELANTEDKLAYYREKKNKFGAVLYPPVSEYNIIKIPVMPYPTSILKNTFHTLKRGRIPLHSIENDVLQQLHDFGYLKISRNNAYLTEDGNILLGVLQKVIG